MNTHIRRARGPVLALLLALTLPSCLVIGIFDEDDDVSNTRHEASRSFVYDVPVQNRVRLDLEAVSGTIEIVGDPAATSVRITGERKVGSESSADATRRLDDLEVQVRELATVVEVRTIQPEHTHGRRYEVDYRITLPVGFRIEVMQVNGPIEIEDISARVEVVNVNGNIELHDMTGSVAVALTNGNVAAEVELPAGGEIDVRTVNGNVDLEIQDDASAAFSAQVTNGSIALHNLTLHGQTSTARSVSGTLGSGLGTIEITTVNGTIVVTGS